MTGSALATSRAPAALRPEPERSNVDPRSSPRGSGARSDGLSVALGEITEIRIYKSNNVGDEIGPVNVWAWNAGAGAFEPDAAHQSWPVCSRNNGGANPDLLGVSLGYSYRLQTALRNLLSVVQFGMHDQTIMRLNPTNQ